MSQVTPWHVHVRCLMIKICGVKDGNPEELPPRFVRFLMQLLWYQNKPHITTISAGCLLSLFVAWCVGRSKVALATCTTHFTVPYQCWPVPYHVEVCHYPGKLSVSHHILWFCSVTLQYNTVWVAIRALKMATESQDIFPTTALQKLLC